MLNAASDVRRDLQAKIKSLNELLWERRCAEPELRAWLENFNGQVFTEELEQLHALHLLSELNYFGLRELRVLLRSMFRDNFRYPLMQSLRKVAATHDAAQMRALFQVEVNKTRFLGMGNPAESGTHLLYYFRQENKLHKDLFISPHEILDKSVRDPSVDFRNPNVVRYVFIDDVCGSGQQSIQYSRTMLADLEHVAQQRGKNIEFHYLVLFATDYGLEKAKAQSKFKTVSAVHVLDSSYRTFDSASRIYKSPPDHIERVQAERIARHYGTILDGFIPLGYGNGQLLLAFHHNIPDNSLPIIWFDEDLSVWKPIFPRYPKVGA